MIENLRATNSDGLYVEFNEELRLTSGLDLSGLSAQVNATESTAPGLRYQNTKLNARNLDLEFQIRRQLFSESIMDNNRAIMYRVFTPESSFVRFDFNLTDGTKYFFTAHTVAAPIMPPQKQTNNDAYQLALVQMICTDPYIYKEATSSPGTNIVTGSFFFPLEIKTPDGIQFGEVSSSENFNVINGGTGKVGMIIKIKANYQIVNPTITNTTTNESIILNFTMEDGDLITINTNRGKRSIVLERNGVTTNIFNSLDFLSSKFPQLNIGENLMHFTAGTNAEFADVSIDFNERFVGV